MIDLQCAIISLRSANLTITAEYLNGPYILFHLDGHPQIYDLSSGVVCAYDWEKSGCNMEQILLEQLRAKCKYPSEKYHRMNDHARALMYHDIMIEKVDTFEVSLPVLATIVTIASRQVNGDELIKGLKAMGFRLPIGIKFTKLYTGGWMITKSDDEGKEITLLVEAFMKDLDKQCK